MTIESQGDVLTGVTSLPVLNGEVSCPDGAVVLSQTCDVVRAELDHVSLAPIVALGDLDAKNARVGKMPRYVHVPVLGEQYFADLDVIATAPKAELLEHTCERGTSTDEEVRTFGAAIARRFGRFAFPDEVSKLLKPLREIVQSKAPNSQSPLGKVLADVVQLRIEAAGPWSEPPWDLTLVIILKPGALPSLDDLPTDHSVPPSAGLNPSAIADQIVAAADPAELGALWNALGESWIDLCGRPADPIRSIESEVVGEDEYTLDRLNRSERLDLDHLSPPTPR